MIKTKQELNDYLLYEAAAYGRSKRFPLFAIKSRDILYKYNYVLRKTEYYYNSNKKIRYYFSAFYLKKLQNRYFINVPINVFGKGLKFIHLGSRIVNSNARVGDNCVMHVNTSIVAGGVKNGAPQIGNDIIMGINSTICGDVKLGNNIAIGGHSFVNKSFEEGNMTIAGVPAKKISNNTKLDWNRGNNNEDVIKNK